MAKITKEQLVKENAKLNERLYVLERKDEELRQNLTEILNYYEHDPYTFSNSKMKPMTWIDIAFRIGELRADANYSRLLQEREELHQEINNLKNPPPKIN